MLAELGHSLPKFHRAATQSRCFAHVINLVVKSILRQFDICNAPEVAHQNNNINLAVNTAGTGVVDAQGYENSGKGEGVSDVDDTENVAGESTSSTSRLNAGVQPVNAMLSKVSL